MASLFRAMVVLGPFAAAQASGAEIGLTREPGAGPVVTISGAIVKGDGLKVQRLFDDALKSGEPVTTLVLNSAGGVSDDGLGIARLVAEAKVTTVVPALGVCSSACFIPWAAGVVRKAERGVCIGVHSAAQTIGRSNVETAASKVRTVDMARIAHGYGVPASIVGQMVITDHKSMYWLSAAEIASMSHAPQPETPVPDTSAPVRPEPDQAATSQRARDGSGAQSREDEAWEAVRASQDKVLLGKFIMAYPKSSHVAQASKIIYLLQQQEMPATTLRCRRYAPMSNLPR